MMVSQMKGFLANKKEVAITVALMVALFLAMAGSLHAGAGGTEFDDVWTTIKDWTQGSLGRVVAGAMVLIGIASGIARQSLMAFALGVGGGIGLFYAPTVLESILSATLPVVNNPVVVQLTNTVGML